MEHLPGGQQPKPDLYQTRGFRDLGHPDAVKSLFDVYLTDADASLGLMYRACVGAAEAMWKWHITPVGDVEFDLAEKYRADLEAGESLASSFFVLADELIDALGSEIIEYRQGCDRRNREFLHVGDGPLAPLSDIFQAAGNYVRHRSEWGRRANATRELSALRQTGQESLRILGKVLSGHDDATDEHAIALILDNAKPMFECLHKLFGTDSRIVDRYSFVDYRDVREQLKVLGYAIIDRLWPEG